LTSVDRPPQAAAGLSGPELDALIDAALAEDLGPGEPGGPLESGDATSAEAVPAEARAVGELVAKAAGVLAGIDVFARAFARIDPRVRCDVLVPDGAAVAPGDVVARLAGPARALLAGERTALNLVQRMSGVATLTARYVAAVRGTGARILDTRKTTPGLRRLEKYAVRCGGGENHRFGLYDEAMVKDNHRDLSARPLADAVAALRARHGAAFRVTVEARTDEEALEAVAAGADVVLLDNMPPARMAQLAPRLRAAAREASAAVEIEASGGVTLETVAAVAAAGVDRVSAGALTHSAPALDLSLLLRPAEEREA
jgi:nicotinate-nucleotide pyrophosphorylase (carboxylating)